LKETILFEKQIAILAILFSKSNSSRRIQSGKLESIRNSQNTKDTANVCSPIPLFEVDVLRIRHPLGQKTTTS